MNLTIRFFSVSKHTINNIPIWILNISQMKMLCCISFFFQFFFFFFARWFVSDKMFYQKWISHVCYTFRATRLMWWMWYIQFGSNRINFTSRKEKKWNDEKWTTIQKQQQQQPKKYSYKYSDTKTMPTCKCVARAIVLIVRYFIVCGKKNVCTHMYHIYIDIDIVYISILL